MMSVQGSIARVADLERQMHQNKKAIALLKKAGLKACDQLRLAETAVKHLSDEIDNYRDALEDVWTVFGDEKFNAMDEGEKVKAAAILGVRMVLDNMEPPGPGDEGSSSSPPSVRNRSGTDA